MDARRLLKLSRGTAPTSVSCIPMRRYSLPRKAMKRSNAKPFTKCLKRRLSRRILTGSWRRIPCGKPSHNGSSSSVLTSYLVKELLGHKTLLPRKPIFGINYVSAQDAVEAMSLDAEDNPRDPLDAFEPELLIAKVIAHGYEVRLRTEK